MNRRTTAKKGEEPPGYLTGSMEWTHGTAMAYGQYCFISVLLLYPEQLACHFVQGLIPGYGYEFPLPANANTLQGLSKAVRRMHNVSLQQASGTCPQSRFRPGIGVDAFHSSASDLHIENAAAAAVVRACGGDYPFLFNLSGIHS